MTTAEQNGVSVLDNLDPEMPSISARDWCTVRMDSYQASLWNPTALREITENRPGELFRRPDVIRERYVVEVLQTTRNVEDARREEASAQLLRRTGFRRPGRAQGPHTVARDRAHQQLQGPPPVPGAERGGAATGRGTEDGMIIGTPNQCRCGCPSCCANSCIRPECGCGCGLQRWRRELPGGTSLSALRRPRRSSRGHAWRSETARMGEHAWAKTADTLNSATDRRSSAHDTRNTRKPFGSVWSPTRKQACATASRAVTGMTIPTASRETILDTAGTS